MKKLVSIFAAGLALTLVLSGCGPQTGGPGTAPGEKAQKLFEQAAQTPDPQQRIRLLTESLALNPDSIETLNNRGATYASAGDYTQAIADFTKALALKPDNPEVLNNRGIAYRNQDDLAKALADFDQAINVKPDFAEAYLNRGLVFQKNGQPDQAITDFTRVLDLNPANTAAYKYRGIALGSKKAYPEAIADFTRALEQSREADTYFNRGITYYRQNHFDPASHDFTATLELAPDFGPAYYFRGLCAEALGQKEAAVNDFRAAAERGVAEAAEKLK